MEQNAYKRYYESIPGRKPKKPAEDVEASGSVQQPNSRRPTRQNIVEMSELEARNSKAVRARRKQSNVAAADLAMQLKKSDWTISEECLDIQINDIDQKDVNATEKIYETAAKTIENNIYYLGEEKNRDQIYETFKIIQRNSDRTESECSLEPGKSSVENDHNETPILAFSNELYDVVRRGSRRANSISKKTRTKSTKPKEKTFPVD